MGSVLGPSDKRAVECRIAALLAGLPNGVPVATVNRHCASGLQVGLLGFRLSVVI